MAVEAVLMDGIEPPAVKVPGADAPVKTIDTDGLKSLGVNLSKLYGQYRSDRHIQELRWLRNLRQYLGYYDPEVEKMMSPERSRAYPKITRVKCITMLAHIMDLMFPSDDKNWTLTARPSADMLPADITAAIQDALTKDQASGMTPEPNDLSYVMTALQELADKRACDLTKTIEDQLQALGGDQTYDYTALNNEVCASSILYGLGLLMGPYARQVSSTKWEIQNGTAVGTVVKSYEPQFEYVNIWEYYPDLAAKRLEDQDGFFLRKVMSRSEVKKLGKRADFFPDVIDAYLAAHTIGNYRPEPFETELRSMGVKINVNELKIETSKYEIIVWHGKIDGRYLEMAGCTVAPDKMSEEIDSEVWLLDGYVIKASMNPWVTLGVGDVRTLHPFLFDKDDTAPIGFGLPNVMRDTQMTLSATARMMLDNASVVCGPILELNTALLRPDQDLTSLGPYKTFYRDDEGMTAQWPAVRDVTINSHLPDLQQIFELFLKVGDMETFVGPMNGGDSDNMPSEPMRNAAGASMLLGRSSLPFKQIIRNFDRFTESVIQSIVIFNKKFNPDKVPESTYSVVARGATSLIAKEVRGMQLDQMATTLQPDDYIYVDRAKFLESRFHVRDLDDMLVSDSEVARRQAQQSQTAAEQAALQTAFVEATNRKLLADAYKGITQGQKNAAGANAEAVNLALSILQSGLDQAAGGTNDAGDNTDPSSGAWDKGQPGADPGASGAGDDAPAGAGAAADVPGASGISASDGSFGANPGLLSGMQDPNGPGVAGPGAALPSAGPGV